ncbi:MAG: DUF4830 domain-containing protein [Oscillospiraceae bacterium]|nr:DUF4830 domain-containing protein [Oscillospiraceae bacterium]
MGRKNTHSKGMIAAGAVLLIGAGIWGLVRLNAKGQGIPAATNDQRIAYINGCGWQTGTTHDELTEIRIPVNFDEVYEDYNDIQLMQGFDLRPYRAHSVKKYTYNISNYRPDGSTAPLPDIYANLLVEDGILIGADISSGEAGSFVTVLDHPE